VYLELAAVAASLALDGDGRDSGAPPLALVHVNIEAPVL